VNDEAVTVKICEGCKSHLNMSILGSQTFDAGDEEQILIEHAIRQDIVKPPTATLCITMLHFKI
jgi:hypothetical protein